MEPKKVILIAGLILLIGGAVAFFWFGGGREGGTQPITPGAQKPLTAGCGNNLCEEGENFSVCPSDCYNPGSSGLELAKLALTSADFPAPQKGTSWVTIYDQLLENDPARVWPALQNHEPLAIHNAVIRLAAPDGLAWDQWGHVEQFIMVYPQNKILNAFEAATGDGLNELAAKAKIVIQELPDPAVGERSKAFKITGQGIPFYVIFFVKKSFLEYITFRGEKYEYQAFPPLARKAAEKIK